MRFSPLVNRVSGDGADAWVTHLMAVDARERGEDVVILSIGDPDLDSPEPVIERAIACLRNGDTHYTAVAGRHALRQAIATAHARRAGQPVSAANVIFLAGAQNALFTASLCVAGPGDEVLALEPLYPTYPATIEVSGARLVRAPALVSSGFRPDLERLESLITSRTRAIFFATPNNPSGLILNEAELAFIGELADRHDLWIISDEVYASLAPGGRVPSLASALPDRVVTIGSLSKSHAMTGWRAGWMVGPTPLIEYVEAVAVVMLYGLPGFVQEAALTALGMGDEAQARMQAFCAERRDLVLTELAGMASLRCNVPDAGMFMLIDVRATGLSGFDFMRQLYAGERVSVLDGGTFGRDTAGFVRLFFGTDMPLLREGCRRIRRFAAGLHRSADRGGGNGAGRQADASPGFGPITASDPDPQ